MLSLVAVPAVLEWAGVIQPVTHTGVRTYYYVYGLLIASTGTVTTVIAVTRCLSVLKPFYSVNYVVVWAMLALLICMCTICSALEWYIKALDNGLQAHLPVYGRGQEEVYLPGLILEVVMLISVIIVLISLICLSVKLCKDSVEIGSTESIDARGTLQQQLHFSR